MNRNSQTPRPNAAIARPSTGLLTGSARQRSVPLRGKITKQAASCYIARLLLLGVEGPKQPILVDVDSPGGLARECLQMLSTMNGIKCPVAVFCRGEVGGTAVVIAAHGLRGFRVAAPHARFSFKPLLDGKSGSGDHSQFFPVLSQSLAMDTQRRESEVLAWLREGAEFSPQEALRHGLIDSIATEPILPEFPAQSPVA